MSIAERVAERFRLSKLLERPVPKGYVVLAEGREEVPTSVMCAMADLVEAVGEAQHIGEHADDYDALQDRIEATMNALAKALHIE